MLLAALALPAQAKLPKISMSIGVSELRTIYTDDTCATDHGKVFKMESMGLYLVEQLRVSHSMVDIAQRMGRVFEQVGAGK